MLVIRDTSFLFDKIENSVPNNLTPTAPRETLKCMRTYLLRVLRWHHIASNPPYTFFGDGVIVRPTTMSSSTTKTTTLRPSFLVRARQLFFRPTKFQCSIQSGRMTWGNVATHANRWPTVASFSTQVVCEISCASEWNAPQHLDDGKRCEFWRMMGWNSNWQLSDTCKRWRKWMRIMSTIAYTLPENLENLVLW